MRKILCFILIFSSLSLAKNHMLKNTDLKIQSGQTAEDIIAVDSRIMINGTIKGSIYVVDTEITLGSQAKIEGDITLTGGRLTLTPECTIKGEVTISGSELETGGLPYKLDDNTLIFADAGFQIHNRSQPVSPALVDFMTRYLVFERPVPSEPDKIISPSFLKDLTTFSEFDNIRISSLIELPFDQQKIKRMTAFINPGVMISFVRFQTEKQSDEFWDELKRIPESKVNQSLQISLGGGAHWYFRHKESTIVMWNRKGWFACVEVKKGDDWKSREDLRDKILTWYITEYKN